MPDFVCSGARCHCSRSWSLSTLTVLDQNRPKIVGKLQANIMDFGPMTNIRPFGMCKSPANPQVAQATAASAGYLTPMPCIPVITSPWQTQANEKVANFPALLTNSRCYCSWGGEITIVESSD